jgi:hypothetical protein
MIIMWDRDDNVFYKISKDGASGMRVTFKPNHVSITVWHNNKRHHEELRFNYSQVPHWGMLEKAWEDLNNLID